MLSPELQVQVQHLYFEKIIQVIGEFLDWDIKIGQ